MQAEAFTWTAEAFATLWPLFLAAFAAGVVDSIGGGGGLITVPTLLNLGIPPVLLLGTNKAISTIGSLPAVLRYGKAGLLPRLTPRIWASLVLFTLLLGGLGAILSQQETVLAKLGLALPFLLIMVMAFMLKRWFWDERRKKPISTLGVQDLDPHPEQKLKSPKALIGLGAVAFYDGLFGPGTGTFFLNIFESLGIKTITANAITKVFNMTSNVGALLCFAIEGRVLWRLGLTAATCYLLGNYLGAGFVLKRGQGLVRIVVLSVTSFLLLRYLHRFVFTN